MNSLITDAEENIELLSFTLHPVDIAWEPETRATMFADAVDAATDIAPEPLTDDDVRTLMKAGFRDAWNYATDDGFSVWIHFHDSTDDGDRGEVKFEYPFYSRSPIGSFFSPSPGFGQSGDELRDELLRSIAVLPLDDEDDPDIGGWAGCGDGHWDAMTNTEREFFMAVRGSLINMNISLFTKLLFDYAQHQTGVSRDE